MAKFKKKLEKFFVYFFTGVSILVVVLGIQRTKHSDAFAVAPEGQSDDENNSDIQPAETQQASVFDAITPQVASAQAIQDKSTKVQSTAQTVSAVGKSYNTPWGNVSASVKVKDGKIVSVEMPTFPDSPPSQYAKAILIEETLKNGSANVQSVSGATITSNAFKASLQSAISLAGTKKGGNAATATTASSTNSWAAAVVDAFAPTKTNNAAQPKANPPVTPVVTTVTLPTTSNVSGTFTGNAFSTPWGNASASITISNGKITQVTMPQIPNSAPSQYAAPTLVQQAIAANGANIQGVSGATVVSNAFKSSLESAIAKATAAGVLPTATVVPVQTQPTTVVQQTQTTVQQQTQTTTQTQTQTQPTVSAPAPTGVTGTFTGITDNRAPSGPLSTTVTLANGRITSITFPQYPDPSYPLNVTAKPILVREAIAANNANIQSVSGATLTSYAFMASLNDALLKAAAYGTVATTNTTTIPTQTTVPQTQATAQQPAPTPAPAPAPTPAPVVTTTATSPVGISGTFIGMTVQAISGPLSAAVTLSNGKITSITFPQYPSITKYPPNATAQPILVNAAIAANTANIQGVSGATSTSNAFMNSLNDALLQAASRGTVAAPSPVTVIPTVTPTPTPVTIRRTRDHDDD